MVVNMTEMFTTFQIGSLIWFTNMTEMFPPFQIGFLIWFAPPPRSINPHIFVDQEGWTVTDQDPRHWFLVIYTWQDWTPSMFHVWPPRLAGAEYPRYWTSNRMKTNFNYCFENINTLILVLYTTLPAHPRATITSADVFLIIWWISPHPCHPNKKYTNFNSRNKLRLKKLQTRNKLIKYCPNIN